MRSMLFVALLALAPAVQAADTSPSTIPAAPSAVAADDGDKVICRREQVSGSNIPGRRVCKLKRDLLAEQAAARDAAKEMTTPSGGSNSN